jgi:general secretion pathway protein K
MSGAAPMRDQPDHPRGVALLSALLSVALLTLIVVEMTDTTLVGSHLTRNAGNTIAAQLLARSAEVAAEGLLLEMRSLYPNKTNLSQLWALPFPDVPVADGAAAFAIEDEQGKLDLNMVNADPAQRGALDLLFEDLDLDPALVERIATWIRKDPNGGVSPEAEALCTLTIHCEPPGGPLRSLDELALIEGFEPAIIERLRPFATAYSGRPGRLGANVNTARSEVLQALQCQVPDRPPPQGYETVEDIECELTDRQKFLHLDSDVFSIQARGSVGDTTETVYAVVDRKGGRAKRLSWRERPVFAVAPIGLP